MNRTQSADPRFRLKSGRIMWQSSRLADLTRETSSPLKWRNSRESRFAPRKSMMMCGLSAADAIESNAPFVDRRDSCWLGR